MKRGALIPTILAVALAACGAHAQQTPPPPAATPPPVELDHVVAIIGSNVLLQSDVEQELHLAALEPLQVLTGENTPDRALRRLINRTLILEQMKQQQQATTTAAPEVAKAIQDLRRQIPACARHHCETDQGWENFLKTNSLTPQLVQERWSQRLAVLHFIDIRFRSGIRIPPENITAYYEKTLVPALAKNHEKAPPLADVESRIREILLQQQVSGLFQDWLTSLRDQGNVRIVDTAYNGDLDLTTGGGEANQ